MGLFVAKELGIQFDSEAITIVESEISKRPRTVGLAIVPVQEGQITKGQVQDAEILGSALKETLLNAKPKRITTRTASLCLGEELVFRKVIEVPQSVTQGELALVVRQEVSQFLPTEPELMEIDFQIVPGSGRAAQVKEVNTLEKEVPTKEKPAKGEKKKEEKAVPPERSATMQVAVVAVEKSIVQDWLAVTNTAKLNVISVEPRANALARALVPSTQLRPVLVAELIREQVVIALIQGGIVWATTVMQLMSSQTEAEHTDIIADESIHLVKLYQNRTESAQDVELLYLVGSDPAKRERIGEGMAKLIPQKLPKLEPLVRCSAQISESAYAAVGTSVFSLGGKL